MIKFNKIPIGIKSCEKYIERRNTCKSTWIASLDKDKYLPLFLVGRTNQPSEIVEDILYLDCDDGYNNLKMSLPLIAYCVMMTPILIVVSLIPLKIINNMTIAALLFMVKIKYLIQGAVTAQVVFIPYLIKQLITI